MNRTFAKLDRIGAQLADLGLVQGEVAEDLFYRNVKGVFLSRKREGAWDPDPGLLKAEH